MNTTNKALIILKLALALSIISFVIYFANINNYSREAYVESNNGEELVLTDIRGHRWGWTIETLEEFQLKENDIVKLKFDNNGTDEIVEDDILIKIKKNKNIKKFNKKY